MKLALRLRRTADFARVRKTGIMFRHPGLMVGVSANSLARNRYGIVIGKRLGIAAIRNRCKRRLRAILAASHHCLKQGYDVVVIARRGLCRQPYFDIQRILKRLLLQAGLLGTC